MTAALKLPELLLTLRAVYNQACLYCSLSCGKPDAERDKHLETAWALLLDATQEPALARRARLDPSLEPLRESREFGTEFRSRFPKAETSSRGRGLAQLRVVGERAPALAKLGIRTTGQLRDKLATADDRTKIGKALGVSEATLSRWRDIAELIDEVEFDLGVRSANLLTDVGIFSLKQLAAVDDAAELRKQLIDANDANHQLESVVGVADVDAWVKAAQAATGKKPSAPRRRRPTRRERPEFT